MVAKRSSNGLSTSGTIIITEEGKKKTERMACIYARVSSAENKDHLERQAERLKDYAIARGYQIYKVVKEIGSGLNDNRPKLAKVLTDSHYDILIVEHKDPLARLGTNHLEIRLKERGKSVEIVNHSEDRKDELMEDLITIITSFCSRLYG
jgi:putative resolvase